MSNTIFGYKIEECNGEWDHIGKIAYKLTNGRTTYRLLRYTTTIGIGGNPADRKETPEMFVINSNGNLGKVKGYSRFTDVNGCLEVVN